MLNLIYTIKNRLKSSVFSFACLPKNLISVLVFIICSSFNTSYLAATSSNDEDNILQPELTSDRIINISRYDSDVALGKLIYIYEDSEAQLDIETIQSLTKDKWAKPDKEIPIFGFTESAIWMHLAIQNSTAATVHHLLEIDNSNLDEIQIYIFKNNVLIDQYLLGDNHPFENRIIFHRNYIVPLTIEADSTISTFLRVTNSGSLQVPLYLKTEREQSTSDQNSTLVWGIYFGMLMIMSLYNLILYFAIKDNSYLFFSLSILSNMIFQSALYGFGNQYIWKNIEFVNFWILPLSMALFFATSSAFISSFLTLKERNNFQYLMMQSAIYFTLAVAVSSPFIDYKYSVSIITYMAIPFAIVAVIVSSSALNGGIKFARFFLSSWIAYAFFIAILAFNKIGILPRNFFTEHGIQIGNILSVIFMSLALAERIRMDKKEKLTTHKELLIQEQKANINHQNFLKENLKRKEDELEAQKEMLLAKGEILLAKAQSKSKSSFLATMSHEIRTPLNGIIGMSDIMADTELNKQQQNYLNIINRSGKSLLIIINDILDFSKIEAGKIKIENRPFDLHELCQEVLESFKVLSKEKAISIHCKLDTELPRWIKSDSNRINQILVNLIGNSLKFTEQGSITLNVSSSAHDDDKTNQIIKFEVIDTGIGISIEQQKKIFRLFSQADGSTTRKYGGTGLGLSICKKLVELMGGEVGIDSELGRGANFWFTINAEKFSQLAEPDSVALNENSTDTNQIGPLQGLKVLIAEDNKVNQMVIINMVKKLGLVSFLVENGVDALAYMKENHQQLDFVLMDCEMPEMDGYDATESIRQWEAYERKFRLPIIALTAHALDEHVVVSMQAGMDAHVSKPVSIEVLRKTIISQLQTKE